MGKRRCTLRDIAELANVSSTTVSMILNGKARENHISEATCKRILKIVGEQNFTPNVHARSISRGKSDLVGIVLRDDLCHSFWAEILTGIEKVLGKSDRHFILSFSSPEPGSDIKAMSFLKRKGVDAYLWTPSENSDIDAVREFASDRPLLALTGMPEGISSVGVDENAGGASAARHFASLGFGKAAAIGQDSLTQSRIKAFHDEFSKSGVCRQFTTVAEFMAAAKEFPAVFCSSDNMALKLYQECGKAGISIPGDISVIGYDNQFFSSLMTPALTTVNQPKESFGKAAGEMLAKMLDFPEEGEVVHRLLPPELVVRNSCRESGF